MTRFTAEVVTFDDISDDSILVGVAAREGRGEALHFQRSNRIERDAVREAPRSYWIYFDWKGQQNSVRSGIIQVELSRTRLSAFLERAAVAHLGEGEFEARLSVSEDDYALLRAGLRLMFAGNDRFQERD